MNLQPIIAASEKTPQWGEFQTGWGNAIFIVTDKGLAVLQPLACDEEFDELIQQQLEPAGVKKLSAGLRVLWSQKISEALVNPALVANLPLDLKGSPFQKSVWQMLLQLRAGQTVTYSELAALVDRPKAVRAVATACAANPLALLVPCHRVLRKDGGLGGYRWGVEMKRYLLKKEGAL
ncbi:AraC family transcriptional regulator, regulatory protein of adaptative response / methylated-DNA-[protein]-cysteine methyltransferase [Marinospirillum celere]|uniref:methylated-DNA--[protein]-cysteine S-methyltransferase n=1 Tax=Marinospirillum celere TaxID=1122252 RepID=A0A1I1GEN1_9GAMM|nr:methylated-DNA--[protein]-cysteine S-methyltransferase [Marinospirillum celere]SFC07610.1 AraC family transcriptional regulator, regulatory protein of adaptative response / methylated-DNA-[protein]-cysteine methyltransferase [Marinospirillum celere]